MKASEFFQRFETALLREAASVPLKRMAGDRPKWNIPIDSGAIQIRVATDSKGSGLLAQGFWPGEYRAEFYWMRGKGKERKEQYVSFFQYTTEPEVESFARIQREAICKFLTGGGPDPYGTLSEVAKSELATPKPNVQSFYFYYDVEDADSYGAWFGSLLSEWLSRFNRAPESNDDWAWRVLWPHISRPTEREAGV